MHWFNFTDIDYPRVHMCALVYFIYKQEVSHLFISRMVNAYDCSKHDIYGKND